MRLVVVETQEQYCLQWHRANIQHLLRDIAGDADLWGSAGAKGLWALLSEYSSSTRLSCFIICKRHECNLELWRWSPQGLGCTDRSFSLSNTRIHTSPACSREKRERKKDCKRYDLVGIIFTSCAITISSFSKRRIKFHLKFPQFIKSSKQKITAGQTIWKNKDRNINAQVSSSSFSCLQSLVHQTL
jgi:hypothetical protein